MTEDDLMLRDEVVALLEEAVVTVRPRLRGAPMVQAALHLAEAASSLTRAQLCEYEANDAHWVSLLRWAHVLLRHGRPDWAAEEAAYTNAYLLYRRRFKVAEFNLEQACMELLGYVGLAGSAVGRKANEDLVNAAVRVIVHVAWMRLMLTRQEAKK